MLLQAISYKSLLRSIYPYRSWLPRPFGPFFKNKETEESYLNTGKRGRFIPHMEIERFYSPTQRR
jgi:hypothetical protein